MGQVVHDTSPAGLSERTMRAGNEFTLWDVHEVDPDGQAPTRYAGYMAGGQLVEPEIEREAG